MRRLSKASMRALISGRVSMSRHGPAWTEALCLSEADLRPSGFSRLENSLSHNGLEDRRIGCDSGVDDQVYFSNAAIRWQRQLRLAVSTHQIGHAKKTFPKADDLQMCRLVFFRAESFAK